MTKINPDKQWKYFNEDIQKFIKENDFYKLGTTYYEMAEFLKDEGKDNIQLKDLGYKAKLKFQSERLNEYKNSKVITKIEIIAVTNCININNNSCIECLKINGKIFAIKEALSLNLLPVKNCSNYCGCRCVYGPSF